MTAINTLKALAIDPETMRPILSNTKGGLSGPAIKPVALRAVYDIREALPDVPIIGCGGVTDWRDAVQFFLAGASAVQIGTGVAFDGLEVFHGNQQGSRKLCEKETLWECKRNCRPRSSQLILLEQRKSCKLEPRVRSVKTFVILDQLCCQG